MPAPRNNQYAKGHGYGRPAMYNDPEEMIPKLESYFEQIEKSGSIPTISGLSLHLGFACKSSLYRYRQKEDFSYCIKRAITMIECYWEQQLNGANYRTAIWMLKKFGWKSLQKFTL